MDFSAQFEQLFNTPASNYEEEIRLRKDLQETRHALQESTSENDQLSELIAQLYHEARVENVATETLISEISMPLFRNVPLPRNADHLPLSEQAGYMVMYMKFLGYAARKSLELYHTTKENYESMNKSINDCAMPIKIKRTGALKVPDLDGVKELKGGNEPKTPLSPPATPPQSEKPKADRTDKPSKPQKQSKQSKEN